MGPDTVVTEVFDMGARAEFFDWLSTEMGADSPRFSFSLTRTLRDLFDMLGEILKEPFRATVAKLVAATPGAAVKAEPAKPVVVGKAAAPVPSAVAAPKPAGAISKTAKVTIVDDDDMPSLEPFSRGEVSPAPVKTSALPSPPVSAVASSSSPSSLSQAALRGQAIFAALSLGRNDKLEEIVRVVNAWPAETVEGFVAAYQLLHK
jgi:hypothetical protein